MLSQRGTDQNQRVITFGLQETSPVEKEEDPRLAGWPSQIFGNKRTATQWRIAFYFQNSVSICNFWRITRSFQVIDLSNLSITIINITSSFNGRCSSTIRKKIEFLWIFHRDFLNLASVYTDICNSFSFYNKYNG